MKPAQIVLIEDNPGDVLLFEMALKDKGVPYQLTRFENGTEALSALCVSGKSNSVPDAIFLDLNTPRSDGFHVLIQLRLCPRLSQVPIAIFTSSQASSDRHRAELLSVRFIQKPSHLEDFLTAVDLAVKEMLRAA